MPPICVDFYLITSDEPAARWLTTCRLLENLYGQGHKVYVHCQNQQQAEMLDELLWTYKDDSFIPHNLQGDGPEPPPPVQIGCDKEPRGFNDVLINFAENIPLFHAKFKKILEVVSGEESEKETSRAHYKEYRSKGYQLQTHKLIAEPQPVSDV